MTDILCCCKPENVVGRISKEAGLLAGLELKETIDEEGHIDEAFSSNELSETELAEIAGYEPALYAGPRRTWKSTRRTWRGK